jgi:hypothetical protein
MKDQKLTPLQRLLNAVGGRAPEDETLAKALPPRRDDDDDEEDDGAPSTEDREKAAAPQAPVNRNDGSPDGDDDADDDDASPDDDANSDADADPDDDDANKEGDEQAPPPQQMPTKKRPPMPLRKAIEEAGDEDVLAEIRRRAQDSPDFLKGLLDGPDAADILEAVDMSHVVAQIVQSASETIAAKDIQIAALTKSLDGMAASYSALVETSDALCEGLAKAIEQQGILIKSFGDVQGDVALIKGQDNGKVSHGQGTLIPPKREEPAAKPDPEEPTGPDALPEGMDMARINRALIKSIEDGTLTREAGKRFMDGVGSGRAQNQRVWKKLPPEVREVALAAK